MELTSLWWFVGHCCRHNTRVVLFEIRNVGQEEYVIFLYIKRLLCCRWWTRVILVSVPLIIQTFACALLSIDVIENKLITGRQIVHQLAQCHIRWRKFLVSYNYPEEWNEWNVTVTYTYCTVSVIIIDRYGLTMKWFINTFSACIILCVLVKP